MARLDYARPKRAERAQAGWGGFLGGLRGDGRGGSIWDRLFAG